jgi:class 3 adenylate cyclase
MKMRRILYNLFIFLINALKLLGFILIFLLLLSFFVQFIDKPQKYPTLTRLIKVENKITNPVVNQIKMAMPHRLLDRDYSRVIAMVLLAILIHFLSLLKYKLRKHLRRLNEEKRLREWRDKMNAIIPKEKMKEVNRKLEELSLSNESDRKVLLQEFVALKSRLDNMGQHLAFLSIDVVDSTGMKRWEDKHLVNYEFNRYNELAIATLKENKVIKYTTTPDGIMSCFLSIDDAVKAAKILMKKLVDFNAKKKIKRDFQIRCGINGGFVYIDEDLPFEQVSDRAIDIAAHMQKSAKPNSINIAASAIEPLRNRAGFLETPNVIDEQKVYEWDPKADLEKEETRD